MSHPMIALAGLTAVAGAYERRLWRQARRDRLTGLGNRRMLNDRLARALGRRSADPRKVGLIMLDLDGFKALNQTLGDEAGDAYLAKVAVRIREGVRPKDTVSRTGDDEFSVLLESVTATEAQDVVSRLRSSFEREIEVTPTRSMRVRASIGLALADPMDDAASLIRHADAAMSAAKAAGGSSVNVWTPELHNGILERRRIETALVDVAGRRELIVEFQPVLDLKRRMTVGAEALVRWEDPARGRIPPASFIPIAEETGSVVQIGMWVLEAACDRTHRLNQQLQHPLHIAVNVSTKQLNIPTLVEDVRAILERTQLSPDLLWLEVTESAMVKQPADAIQRLSALRSLGVKIALDDFGTGYSSLSYLRTLPFDILKIDRSFVEDIAKERDNWALASAVVKLAGRLGKETVAEGVETGAQFAHIRSLECDMAQGFFFSKPLTFERFEEHAVAATPEPA